MKYLVAVKFFSKMPLPSLRMCAIAYGMTLQCSMPITGQSVKKVKCTVVQALRFCTGCTAHRGGG